MRFLLEEEESFTITSPIQDRVSVGGKIKMIRRGDDGAARRDRVCTIGR